ncbi:MAG: hypothetical protein P9M00_00605 [Candidatus Tritonobacter lacicola]|nr:hypothetical protein [Candidatus Tritonobacter lacicola]
MARILQKIADGKQLSAKDISKIDNAVIRVDDTQIRTGDPELSPLQAEKSIYILKVDRGDTNFKQLLQMQKAMLQSQLTLLRVLAVIARHQDRIERRVARSENINRELGLGMKDLGHGVDMARVDISSTNAETTDIGEMTAYMEQDIIKLMKMLGGSPCRR